MIVLAVLCFIMAALALYLAAIGVERHFKQFLIHSTKQEVRTARQSWLVACATAVAAGIFLLQLDSRISS